MEKNSSQESQTQSTVKNTGELLNITPNVVLNTTRPGYLMNSSGVDVLLLRKLFNGYEIYAEKLGVSKEEFEDAIINSWILLGVHMEEYF